MRYWNQRWKYEPNWSAMETWEPEIRRTFNDTKCYNILDVGCGPAALRGLPGYLGCDFSRVALEQSGLETYLQADVTRGLPLATDSFDMVLCANVLLHIRPEHIGFVAEEIKRVACKVVVLVEPPTFEETEKHCFSHDLPKLFGDFKGEVYVLNKKGKVKLKESG